MQNDHYIVVFDVSSSYRQWWLPALLSGSGLVIGIISVLIKQCGVCLKSRGFEDLAKLYVVIFLLAVILILGGMASFLGTFGDYLRDSYLLASGKTAYVEGSVDNFLPMPYEGHANETFTVKGVSFSYSDYQITEAFNKSSSHGGPIRKGLPVRIWYVKNDILKLEIKK